WAQGSAGGGTVLIPPSDGGFLGSMGTAARRMEKRYSMCEHSLNRVPLGLTLEDLEQPSLCEQQGNMVNTRNKVSAPRTLGTFFPSRSSPGAVSLRNAEDENKHLRSKVNSLQEQNASLASKNQSLADKLEVAQSKQVNTFLKTIETIWQKAEDGLQQSQDILAEKESILRKFREELKNVKVQLYDSSKQCKRAEKQRNAALLNAEELTRAFQQYKVNIAEKLEKVKSEEETLNKNFSNCEKQRTNLQERCMTLEQELESTKAHLRILQSEKSSGKESQACALTNNAELIALLTQSNQRVLRLEAELENKARVLNENIGLLQENKALKEHLAQQSRPLEVTQSQLRDSNAVQTMILAASLSFNNFFLRAQIFIKEAENKELQFRLLGDEGNAGFQALDAEPVKLISRHTDERDLQLETLCKQLQTKNERLTVQLKDIQDKLGKVQTEATSAKRSMAQRTSQFQVIQQELMEKASKTTSLQQELTKKSLKIATLQKLLEEKSMTCSTAAAKNAELEEELMSYKEQIFRLEENVRKEHEEVLSSFERSKQIYAEQQKELQNKIENLQCQLNMKSLHVTEQDHTLQVLQHDTESKQQQIESLDHILTETRRELDLHTKNASDTMRMLENQVEDETDKVRHLESALTLCKEELVLYLQQLEENRHSFSNQIKKKSEELQCLREEIKHRTQSLQETNEENVRLQQTLQQQQQMLQQGTTRIGELEDTQAESQQQVCQLELQIEKQRFTLEEQLRKSEEKLLAASQELELKREQVLELNDTIMYFNTAEKHVKKNDELELELLNVKKQLQKHVKHIQELEETLTKIHLSLEEKESIVQRLAEELRTCKQELEDRDHEILDMNEALKDRNWELKQRAAQLNKLDMSIREHKEETEQKITRLESDLEKARFEKENLLKQISCLDEKNQEMRNALCEKDFELLDKEQSINPLKMEIEKNRLTIQNMEKMVKTQELCISEQQQDSLDLSQEVRLARERMQVTHLELVETRQKLAEAHKESERLNQKLEAMDQLSREKVQHRQQDLEEAQDTICNLKTELDARNEVIKATNDVLILKESEITRLKARISGYNRIFSVKSQNTSILHSGSLNEFNSLESHKYDEASEHKPHKLCRSLSASDSSLVDLSSLDLPKSILEDLKNIATSDVTNTHGDIHHMSSNPTTADSSFNPLEYTVDMCETTSSDCTELGTLSGMLKYIQKEMKETPVSPGYSRIE
uniref:Coiled-coil domain containing 18 n=1 Tax=Leptobrachium leishanense TaxID=445787 RepID=A0A8C5WGN3_9ANUR